tara:strand:- start:3404 stop:4534 length:1131 start_codon:yes stop_codon:yes gene_type:complete
MSLNGLIYHSAQPEATQSTYTEFNNMDFILNVGEGRSLMKNSVRLNADILITNDGTTRSAGKVFLDYRIGAHAVIESVQVSFGGGQMGGGGLKENIQNYARWVAMRAIGSIYEDDYLNAGNMCELRAINAEVAGQNALGEVTEGTTPLETNMDFSLKPNCILNNMMGDALPFEKSGEIRLTLNLARNMSALMGANKGNGAHYQLVNPHVSYHSMPTNGDPSKTQTSMRSVYNVKSTILSTSANISAQVPAVCDAVSCSFQYQSRENVNTFSNTQCETVQNIRRVEFLFNDSTNKYITYQMSDQNEMIHRYIDSFGNSGHNQMMLDTFRANNGFGIGLHFQGFIDLSKQRFGVQLTSDVDNTKPMNIYMYFHSMLQA